MPGRSRRKRGVGEGKGRRHCIEEFWRCSGWSEAHARAGRPCCVPQKRGCSEQPRGFRNPRDTCKTPRRTKFNHRAHGTSTGGSRNSLTFSYGKTRTNQTTDGAQRVPHGRGAGISGLRVSYWPACACVAWRTSLLASERRSALNRTTSHNRPGRAIPHNGSSIPPPEQFAALPVCPQKAKRTSSG